MQTKRVDHPTHTEILIWNDGAVEAYRITCANFGPSPTAHISLLCVARATIEEARRLAAEYAYVADLAEQLQEEKRTGFGEPQE